MHLNASALRAMQRLLRPLLLLGALLSVVLPMKSAWAAGTLAVVNASPDELDGRWKLDFKITLGRAPDFQHVGMVFEFTPVVVYERYLDEKTGDKPAIAKRPVSDATVHPALVDVGFGSPTGKVYATTKFNLVIKRSQGFEAGEYDLVVRKDEDRSQVGQKVRLKLQGENPVVDRRPLTFSPEKKAAKPAAPKPAEPPPVAEPEDQTSGEGASEEEPATEPEPTPKPSRRSIPNGPSPVPPRQGSCGCELAGSSLAGPGAWTGLLALGLAALVRRRTRS